MFTLNGIRTYTIRLSTSTITTSSRASIRLGSVRDQIKLASHSRSPFPLSSSQTQHFSSSALSRMKFPGSCYCRAIKYEIDLASKDDARTSICHCKNCKVRSGLLLRVWVARARKVDGSIPLSRNSQGATTASRLNCPSRHSSSPRGRRRSRSTRRITGVGLCFDESSVGSVGADCWSMGYVSLGSFHSVSDGFSFAALFWIALERGAWMTCFGFPYFAFAG